MPAPTDATLKWRPGTNGIPTDDTSAIGGAIDTGTELADGANLVQSIYIPTTSDLTFYGVAYRKNESTGTYQGVKFRNRAALVPNAGAGPVQLVGRSALDTGTARIVGKVSSAWQTESVTLQGLTPVFSSNSWDAGSIRRIEHLVGGAPADPSDAITASCNGAILGILYGTLSPGGPVRMISDEWEFALATAKNTTLSASNRLTAPTGISSWVRGAQWTGVDQSLAVPGSDLAASDYIGVAVRVTLRVGIPAPTAGYSLCDIDPYGTPV